MLAVFCLTIAMMECGLSPYHSANKPPVGSSIELFSLAEWKIFLADGHDFRHNLWVWRTQQQSPFVFVLKLDLSLGLIEPVV